METWTLSPAVFKRAGQSMWATGVILLPIIILLQEGGVVLPEDQFYSSLYIYLQAGIRDIFFCR